MRALGHHLDSTPGLPRSRFIIHDTRSDRATEVGIAGELDCYHVKHREGGVAMANVGYEKYEKYKKYDIRATSGISRISVEPNPPTNQERHESPPGHTPSQYDSI